jgi:cytochrome c-type biogenesis protein CcmH
MILFWLICAALVAIALAFILPPLLQQPPAVNNDEKEANVNVYRDQISELEADLRNGLITEEQYQQDRDGIERRLLEDMSSTEQVTNSRRKVAAGRGPVYAIALGIPILAVAMYLRVGNPSALSERPEPSKQNPFSQTAPAGEMPSQNIETNVATLAKRLEQNPGDADGWTMLARSYANMEKFSEARDAYAKASALKPDDADLLADYAFAMAMTNGRQIQGESLALVKKSLKLDPANPKALELAGSAEFQAKNYKQAIDYWQKILDKTPANSELAQVLTQRISEAKSLADAGSKN